MKRNRFLTTNKTRSILKYMLPGNYVSGFVDGEGCFSLRLQKDIKRFRPNSPIYLFWKLEFCIVLRSYDTAILEKIKDCLGCGTVFVGKKFSRLSINKLEDLNEKIIPFFRKYPLQADKRYVFELWTKAVKSRVNDSKKSIVRSEKENSSYFQAMQKIYQDLRDYRNARQLSL